MHDHFIFIKVAAFHWPNKIESLWHQLAWPEGSVDIPSASDNLRFLKLDKPDCISELLVEFMSYLHKVSKCYIIVAPCEYGFTIPTVYGFST
jgi:hypothetical protein